MDLHAPDHAEHALWLGAILRSALMHPQIYAEPGTPVAEPRDSLVALSLRVGERAIWNAFLGIPEVLTRARQSRA